jgi:hypothetical protein
MIACYCQGLYIEKYYTVSLSHSQVHMHSLTWHSKSPLDPVFNCESVIHLKSDSDFLFYVREYSLKSVKMRVRVYHILEVT